MEIDKEEFKKKIIEMQQKKKYLIYLEREKEKDILYKIQIRDNQQFLYEE
jgi:hypothetical protein